MSKQTILVSEDIKLEITDTELFKNNKQYKPKEDEDFREVAQRKKRDYYKKKLEKLLQADNLLLLTGAGTSIGFGGKTMYQLWKEVEDIKYTKNGSKGDFNKFCELIEFDQSNKDLELLLSEAEINIKSKKVTPKWFIEIKRDIELTIKQQCSFNLTDFNTHLALIQKLTQRKISKNRLKIFNLNYDMCFEQAAQEGGFVVIDGFSFSQPRVFNGRYFDYDIVRRENSRISAEENYVDKVFHLYKPHGSVNWYKQGNDILQRNKIDDFQAVIIYPNATKFEHSYEQPFFEVMSRFQSELRKTKSTTLIIAGFSLADKHIMTMIKEAIRQNSSLNVLIVNKDIQYKDSDSRESEWLFYRQLAELSQHITIVSETFADFVKNIPYDISKKPEEIFLEKLENIMSVSND